MKCEKSGNHTISYQSLLLSTTILNDNTPLHEAADYNHLQIVELLLSKGAEVDNRNSVSIFLNVM